MLQVGNKAPEFIGIDQDGITHQLKDYLGKKLVVFFYPKASTPGCTAEACDLRDNYHLFVSKGYKLIGVSQDDMSKQKKFKEKNFLPFPLISDTDRKLIEAYGVWGPKKFMGKSYDGIHRTTFVIDENGVIEQVIEKVKTKAHSSQILP